MKNRNLLFLAGRPFSPFYSLLMMFRELMYKRGVLPVAQVDVPVVSVGNLTLGGSGKTPVVQYLARLLKSWGQSPAIISRGYGGASREKVNIVSSGNEPLLDASLVGDEPRFLAESLPGVAVLTGAVRKHPARKAVELGSDILVLDDGFQHMALERTVDLVLFNADSLAGNSRVFPGGDLREPVKALNRCDAFIMTGVCDRNRDRAERFADLLKNRFPDHPVFYAEYKAVSLVKYNEDGTFQDIGTSDVQDIGCVGFSGIAHTERFEQTLQGMGIEVKSFKAYLDHHPYKERDMKILGRIAEQVGAEALVTTEKDMVKLKGLSCSLPLYSVRMEAVFDSSFHDYLKAQIAVNNT